MEHAEKIEFSDFLKVDVRAGTIAKVPNGGRLF